MKISVCFVLVFCFVTIAGAQERVIDKTEFDSAVVAGMAHGRRWKNEKYRWITSTSSKTTGRPQYDWAGKYTFEYISPDVYRNIGSTMLGGKPSAIQESIVVGKWRYSRKGDDPWTRKTHEPSPAQTHAEGPENLFETVESVAEYKYLGKEYLAGRATNVFRKTERRTTVNKKNGETREFDGKSTYWFGEDGLALKHEYRGQSRGGTVTGEMQTLVLMEWTIDPSLTINEPVVAGP